MTRGRGRGRRRRSEPANTRTVASSIVTGVVSACSKKGSTLREASGSTTQSCTPCSSVVAGVDTSECEMPRPAVIRLTSPGRTISWLPVESRCSISPSKSQLTVCSPVWGWGGTTMPPVAATSSGP